VARCDGVDQRGPSVRSTCGNVNVVRSNHKSLGKSYSSIHGYGMYAREAIAANEFVYEYTGAMLSQDEAERRGLIYDRMEMSYLFDLNEDAVLDALRCGNKSKFINHEGDTPNCTAKVVSVCGVHHITIWALRDIAVGEELVFDYGYKRSVGGDWSQKRAASKDTRD
jgi:SET domain-containing protein